MKRIKTFYQNMRLRKKMILSHFVIAFIPLLVFSLMLGAVLVKDARTTSQKHMMQMTTQMSESIDVYIQTINKLMDSIVHMLESGDDSEGNVVHMQNMLREIIGAYYEIAGVMIAYENDTYVTAGMTRVSKGRFWQESWFQEALAHDGKLCMINSAVGRNVVNNANDSSDRLFSLAKSFDSHSQKGKGVLLIDIRHDIIEQLIDSIVTDDSSFLYVADEENNIVYTPTNSLVYRIDDRCFEGNHQEARIWINGQTYMIFSHFSPYTSWRSIGVISEHVYLEGTTPIIFALLLCTMLMCLIVSLLTVKISDSITLPILKLRRIMLQVEEGDLSVRFNTAYEDEIGELGNSFNSMLERINTLIQQLYVEEQAKLEAQMKILREQIKPHFLYNTLDTINWMARSYKAYDVVKLVEALANMFRIGLSKGQDFISVYDEVLHVQNYLYIQKTRYQDKLQYSIDVSEDLNDIRIPKMILQPLVENSIYHGIKQKRGSGTVKICGWREQERIILTVEDDGKGMPEETLAALQEYVKCPSSSAQKIGFGLSYIADRLSLIYKNESVMTIDSAEGKGTVITIMLPISIGRGGNHV